MQPLIFESDTAYIQSATTIEEKIAKIDEIIDALYEQMLKLAQTNTPINEYMLNDGQTIVKGIYRTSTSIVNTINILTMQRNRYANKGRRVYQMVDVKNFTGRR